MLVDSKHCIYYEQLFRFYLSQSVEYEDVDLLSSFDDETGASFLVILPRHEYSVSIDFFATAIRCNFLALQAICRVHVDPELSRLRCNFDRYLKNKGVAADSLLLPVRGVVYRL